MCAGHLRLKTKQEQTDGNRTTCQEALEGTARSWSIRTANADQLTTAQIPQRPVHFALQNHREQ